MEFEMRARLNRIKLRDLALFVVVAGVVAVAGVFIGREAGLGDREAGAQGEPLILTLTPEADHCVTKDSLEAWGIGSDGARQTSGWVVVAEAAVRWYVAGGEPPYTLKINGKSADADGQSFSGASGRATVGCANTSASWRWGEWSLQPARYYASDPELDAGWMTIETEVEDAEGRKAKAEVDVYVVVDLGNGTSGDILVRGKTYRIDGHLITTPVDYDVRVGGMAEVECPESLPADQRCETTYSFRLVGVDAGIKLYHSDYAVAGRYVLGDARADDSRGKAIEEALDEFSDSVGVSPRQDRGSQ